MSRSTHKWYPISGTHEDSKCLRNGFLLINPTSSSILENSFKWYTSTCGINHARRWFHKWSSTLSDHQMKITPSPIRAQVYPMDNLCYHIGGGVP